MEITNLAVAGTLESSDAMVTIGPNKQDEAVVLNLQSSVEKQYGRHMREVVLETLRFLDVSSAIVSVVDKGALDCALKARVETAAYRAAGNEDYRWEIGQK